MIQISRLLARRLRAVFRKCTSRVNSHRFSPMLHFQASKDGLRIRMHDQDIAAEYHADSDIFSPEELVLPMTALADFESGKPEPVQLNKLDANRVQASWVDRSVPQLMTYDGKELKDLPPHPALPAMTPIVDRFLQALADAQTVTAAQAVRYATDKIQLKKAGKVIATDGRQLLVHDGFRFSFKDDFIVPALPVWNCKELASDKSPISIGTSDKHLVIKVGQWTFWLAIDKESRYPHVEDVIPRASTVATRLSIPKEDGKFLIHTLPRLPGNADENSVITVDANGKLAIRAKASDQTKPTEVVLASSKVIGKPERFCINREYLAKALSLGFVDFHIVDGDKPIVCRDVDRQYAWMTLGKTNVILPTEDCIRITSTDTPIKSTPTPMKGIPSVANHNHPQNGTRRHIKRQKVRSGSSLLGEVMALKTALRDSSRRASMLASVVRKQQRQNKLVGNALKSLRELEKAE